RGPDDEGYLLADLAKGTVATYSGLDSPQDVQAAFPLFSSVPAGSYQLGLGFRRLSILELSACGHQPMQDTELQLSITFNGEIYNYLELRTELKGLGYRFHSK
ncbi:MAG: asparagine synthetase B, partial [Candidatus Cloacimonas sp.]|nr:asparagine synthetase B [Candidatus Cloacimonas sp.]